MSRYQSIADRAPRAAAALQGDHVWVQAIADDGTWGLGRTGFGDPVRTLVGQVFGPLLVGMDAFAYELQNDVMWRASLRAGDSGHAAPARSAIDIALWDLRGRLLGVPVFHLLGGPVRDKLQCYATCDDLDWAMELGFEGFKVSNEISVDDGTAGIRAARDKLFAARETVGADAELMYNPIMPFTSDYAVRLAHELRQLQIRWLEEPLQPWDDVGLKSLRSRAPFMPIATGEDHHGRHAFDRLIRSGSVDVLQPDIEWCGGVTEALRIRTMAEAAGIELSAHVAGNTPWGQHFALATSGASQTEFWLGSDPGIPLEDVDRIPGTAVPRGGRITVEDQPGFGLAVRPEWIQPA